MNKDVVDVLRPLLNLPVTMSKLNKEQTESLKKTVNAANNSFEINELTNSIRGLERSVGSIPEPAKPKSTWWPAITIALFSSFSAVAVALALFWYSDTQRPEKIAQWFLNHPASEKLCTTIGFELSKQSNGNVFCVKLIHRGKQ